MTENKFTVCGHLDATNNLRLRGSGEAKTTEYKCTFNGYCPTPLCVMKYD